MTIDHSNLTGLALDWAVALASGRPADVHTVQGTDQLMLLYSNVGFAQVRSHLDPGTMHMLMKMENIMVSPPTRRVHVSGGPAPGWRQIGTWSACTWTLGASGGRSFGDHETEPAVAVARCFVMARLGRKLDIPEELL